jgi:hypothetical protein
MMDVRYPLMPKEQSREVRRAIRSVFVEVWDPIGVMDDPTWPRDEYDSYIGCVFELLVQGGSDKKIIEYLEQVVGRIGMDASRVSLQGVVKALRGIPIAPKPE